MFGIHSQKLVVSGDSGTGIDDRLKQVALTAYGSDPGQVGSKIHPLISLDVTSDAQGLGRIVKKFLPMHGVSLGKESGKLVEALGLAGLFSRIRFDGIGQLDLRYNILRRALLVDLVHQPNLFAHRVVNRKTLVPNLIQCISNGMFQERICHGQACLQQRLHRPVVPYPT